MTILEAIQDFPNRPRPMGEFQQAIKDKTLFVNGKRVKKETEELKEGDVIEEVKIGNEVIYTL